MAKKTILGVVVVVILAVAAFVVFAMNMRRSHMMGGGGMGGGSGSQLELVAVSAEGAQISPSADVTSVTGELPQGTVAQKAGDLIVSLALNPYPPRAGAPSEFDVTLTDLSGKAIDDAVITLDLTMPSMWMPPNQPAMEFVSDGKYNTSTPFTMRGEWRIEVIITRGDEKQSAFFDVGL
jgi:hypothetical protein